MKLSRALRGCPFLKGTVSTYGCRTKLFPLQTERNHPAHGAWMQVSTWSSLTYTAIWTHHATHSAYNKNSRFVSCAKIQCSKCYHFFNKILAPTKQSFGVFSQLSTMHLQQEEDGMNLQYWVDIGFMNSALILCQRENSPN